MGAETASREGSTAMPDGRGSYEALLHVNAAVRHHWLAGRFVMTILGSAGWMIMLIVGFVGSGSLLCAIGVMLFAVQLRNESARASQPVTVSELKEG